jgi:8-oxo-dGTP pyrophosphatase MutT (NUDIX family)
MPTRAGNPSWRLPKGCIEEGESSKEAAIRETREETGCLGEIVTELDDIQYWYTRRDDQGERSRIQKKVDFYLMAYQNGHVSNHDNEVDEAAWFSFAEALKTISYDAERRVLQEAIHAWDAFNRD